MALLYKCVYYYYYYFGGDFDVFDDGDSEKLSDNNDVLMTREMESGAVSISLHHCTNQSMFLVERLAIDCGTNLPHTSESDVAYNNNNNNNNTTTYKAP